MPANERQQLENEWRAEEAALFTGWDFSYLNGRRLSAPLPWSYDALVRQLLPQCTGVLDLSTGGGEKLLSFRDVWPAHVRASEAYVPNLELAQARLAPFGAQVLAAAGSNHEILPFAEGEFDLVLNRHGPFNSAEVRRVLRPDGVFITQQVDGRSGADLIAAFTERGPLWPEANLAFYQPLLVEQSFVIERAESFTGQQEFTDVGALVYYLKAVPWLVDNFSVDNYLPQLWRLQAQLESNRPLIFHEKHYLIQARFDG